MVSVTIVCLTAWAGLRFADRLNMPMPLLRNWEINKGPYIPAILLILKTSISWGVIAACATIACNVIIARWLHLPTNPGNLITRIATVVWAPVITETISHLFLLSGIVIIIKSKAAGNILSGLVFVILFHFSSSYGFALASYISSLNFLLAILTGYLFIKRGFETAVLTHMIAHIILLIVNI